MDRFMIHLRNSGYSPTDAQTLLKKADNLSSGMNVIIRDMRVSTKYLEFDTSVAQQELDMLVDKLSPLGVLDHARRVVEEEIDRETAICMAIQYFNDERFWECHEVLEGVWKQTFEGEKDLVQGIILVAAALVHYQKDEDEICLSIMNRAMEKLATSTGIYHDIEIDGFKKKVADIIKTGKISTFTI